MKTAVVIVLIVACAFASEDVRPKRSLYAYPTFYSSPAFYGAPWAAPAALSPVVARASTIVGQPGFVPRYGYLGLQPAYPYGYWPGSPAVLLR